jgi:hypothetical protein
LNSVAVYTGVDYAWVPEAGQADDSLGRRQSNDWSFFDPIGNCFVILTAPAMGCFIIPGNQSAPRAGSGQ